MSDVTSTVRALEDGRGAVRVEEVYDTDLDDLWSACTEPARLARWVAQVSGEPGPGRTVEVLFTSTWSGPVRVDVCDAPHHLLLTAGDGIDEDETQIEAWLSAAGSGTRLVVEERGLPVAQLHVHEAGWQVHLEDLDRSLRDPGPVHPDGWSAQAPAPGWHRRWAELTAGYRAAPQEGGEGSSAAPA